MKTHQVVFRHHSVVCEIVSSADCLLFWQQNSYSLEDRQAFLTVKESVEVREMNIAVVGV